MTERPEDLIEAPELPDPLFDAIERLRLEGAIFLRGQYREAWAYTSPTGEMMAQLLVPGAERLVYFHIVARGSCYVEVDGFDRVWARAGDVVVLPYGHQHEMGGVEPVAPVAIETQIEMPPWTEMPVIEIGGGGAPTDIVCGYLQSDDPLFDPAHRAFLPVFTVRPDDGSPRQWVQSSIEYAMAATARPGGPTTVATRLPELLLIEILRQHAASAPTGASAWVAALRDPVLAPCLGLMHARPEHKWTVAELAAAVNVSRSVLEERFRRCLDRSPMRYLADWRMHRAGELLSTTDLGVGAIAQQVGYDSIEAFSRAFKRDRGESPAAWREARAARA